MTYRELILEILQLPTEWLDEKIGIVSSQPESDPNVVTLVGLDGIGNLIVSLSKPERQQ